MSLQTPQYPGVNPTEDRGYQINIVAIVFISLSAVTLACRFASRLWTRIELWIDDWLIVGAAVFSWAYSAICIVEVQDNYYGQHVGMIPDPEILVTFSKELYALAIIYPIALTLSKLSLLALYWRIFRITTARLPLQIVAAINIAWMIAAFLVGIFSCRPVQGFWDTSVNPTCIDDAAFFLSNEAITITLDLVVLLIPVFFISHIQRSLQQRISISITFLLGLIVTVVSAIRLWRLVVADGLPQADPTYDFTDAALWAIVELNVWVLVASIPSLRPAVNKFSEQRGWRSRSGAPKTVKTYDSSSGNSWKNKFRGRSKQTGSSNSKSVERTASETALTNPTNVRKEAFTGDSTDYSTSISASGVRNTKSLNDEEHGMAPIPLDDLGEHGGVRVERQVEVKEELRSQTEERRDWPLT